MRKLVVLLALVPPLAAEIGPRSEEERSAASHVIATGAVKAVYSFRKALDERGYENAHYVIELSVAAVEKGEGAGKLLYARGWQATRRPDGWAGGSGHYFAGPEGKMRGLDLRAGDRVRVFLVRAEDGGLDLVLPNGVDVLPAAGDGSSKGGG